jgi:hypothetical protein
LNSEKDGVMMSKTLDCTSTESAFESISTILEINSDKLRGILQDIRTIPKTEEPKAFINQKVFSKIPPPTYPIPSIWFHATRVINPNSFIMEGIHPTSVMYPKIYSVLKQLSQEIKSFGDYPNSSSASAKKSINDEGPFAFLFRSVAVNARGINHAYYESPEIVEDIAGSLLGANYKELVSKYMAVSQPYVVTFRAGAEDYVLESAIWYAYLIVNGCDDFEAAGIANTCFDGKGVRIPPTDIINVQILK